MISLLAYSSQDLRLLVNYLLSGAKIYRRNVNCVACVEWFVLAKKVIRSSSKILFSQENFDRFMVLSLIKYLVIGI